MMSVQINAQPQTMQAVPMQPVMMMQQPQPIGFVQSPPGVAIPMAMVTTTASDYSMLAPFQELVVKQEMEMLEIMTGFEMQNKYTIMTKEKQPILHAAESSEFCARCCLGGSRPFTMKIMNGSQQILTIQRDCRLYFHRVSVINTLNGELFGSVVREFSCCERNYVVLTPAGEKMFFINGPCCSPWTFDITDMAGQPVAKISKKWGGLFKEMFTDADTFAITFDRPVEPKMKAVLLGGVFLIDFMYFEENDKKGMMNS